MKKRRDKKEIRARAWKRLNEDVFMMGMSVCDGIVVISVERGIPTSVMPIKAASKKHKEELDRAMIHLQVQSWKERDKIPCRVCGERRA
jgi:hypothetical protein